MSVLGAIIICFARFILWSSGLSSMQSQFADKDAELAQIKAAQLPALLSLGTSTSIR